MTDAIKKLDEFKSEKDFVHTLEDENLGEKTRELVIHRFAKFAFISGKLSCDITRDFPPESDEESRALSRKSFTKSFTRVS